jgi:hypothetical protein
LNVETPIGSLVHKEPHAFEMNWNGVVTPLAWDADFVDLGDGLIGFQLNGSWNPNRRLVIQVNFGERSGAAGTDDDWVTYYGGNHLDVGTDVIAKNGGRPHFIGGTFSDDFPDIPGTAIQSTNLGSSDVYISTFHQDDAHLLWSTYYGGTQKEEPYAIDVNSNNEIYVVGWTQSLDFPVTEGTPTFQDAFIIKISSGGTTVPWARTFGDPGVLDFGMGVTVTNSNHVIMVGWTASLGVGFFPSEDRVGSYNQSTGAGAMDGFIADFGPDNTLVWSTLFGGPNDDLFYDVQRTLDNHILICGKTTSDVAASTDPGNTICDVPQSGFFPNCELAGAYNQLWSGGGSLVEEGIIVDFDENGALTWATYVGGTDVDILYRIAIDPVSPNTFAIAGVTTSETSFPHVTQTGDYFQSDQGYLAARFENRNMVWSTTFGCGETNFYQYWPRGIAFDQYKNLYIAGQANCSIPTDPINYCDIPLAGDFPICQGNNVFFQDDGNGIAQYGGDDTDGFIAGFNSSNELIWSTYFGGGGATTTQPNGTENIYSLTYDDQYNRLYLTGVTGAFDDFPILDPGIPAYMQPDHDLNFPFDAFLARLNIDGITVGFDELELSPKSSLLIYPNPSNEIVFLYVDELVHKTAEILITDMTGKVVLKKPIAETTDGTIPINISTLAAGMYIVQLATQNRTYNTKLIVK